MYKMKEIRFLAFRCLAHKEQFKWLHYLILDRGADHNADNKDSINSG